MSDHSPPDGGTVVDLFTTVPVDLFRMGNASGPRLDNVRPQDVPTEMVSTGSGEVEMVSPEGGISTFDDYRAKPGKWWKIPSGVVLPPEIRIVKDGYNRQMRAYHYSLRPARLMAKLTFIAALKELATHATPMFSRSITEAGDGSVKTGGS